MRLGCPPGSQDYRRIESCPGFEPAQLTELDAFVLVKDVCVVVESLLGHAHYPYRLVGWSR